jgi:branched-chain amino acid transport system permease protein
MAACCSRLPEKVSIRFLPLPSGIALGMPLLLIILFLTMRPTGLVGSDAAAR